MAFDKRNLAGIRADMHRALVTVGDAHGVSFKIGSMSYTADRFTCRVESVCRGMETNVVKNEWDANCLFFGLKDVDFGKTIRVNNMSGTICGLKPRAHKYPVLVKTSDGKTYKLSAEDVRLRLSVATL